jgi:hypothetical protein
MEKKSVAWFLENIKCVLKVGLFLILFCFLMAVTSAQGQPEIGVSVQPLTASIPEARTLWEFMDEYTGEDKVTRILNSFTIGKVDGCSGTMISPHILMTAAHCGGPDHAVRNVYFFRIDEDTSPSSQNQVLDGPYRARSFP